MAITKRYEKVRTTHSGHFSSLGSSCTSKCTGNHQEIDKQFPYKEGYELNIEGEKAEVFIEAWDKNEIVISLEIIAKHPDKTIAERDLSAMQYLAQRVKNKIYL